MSWNLRIIKQSINGEISIGIHEVFYNENNDIVSYTIEPVAIKWTNDISLVDMKKRLNRAFDEEVLLKEQIDEYLMKRTTSGDNTY